MTPHEITKSTNFMADIYDASRVVGACGHSKQNAPCIECCNRAAGKYDRAIARLRSRSQGATVIEVVISIAIVGIVLAILVPMCISSFKGDQARAEQEAVEFFKKHHPNDKLVAASCVANDSNKDGYQSCTVSFTVTDGRQQDLSLLCAFNRPTTCAGRNAGCKIDRPSIR